MIFKFKNGYQVQIRDCAGKSREELIEIAKKAVKDAVHSEETKQGYIVVRMFQDQDSKGRVHAILYRPNMDDYVVALGYNEDTGEWDQGIYDFDSYDAAVSRLYKVKNVLKTKGFEDAVSLEKRIDTNVSFMPTKMKTAIEAEDQDMFDRELKFLARDLEADLSESHKNYPKVYRKEVLEKLIKQYEDAGKLVKKADDKFGTDNAKVVFDKIATIRENWDMTRGNSVEDARDIPPYRVKITYANGEVTIKYEDDLTAAVKDIRDRIEAGKKDGNAVAVALVYDCMTDEIVLSSDRDEDIRVKDVEEPKFRAYINYVDLGARKKEFDTIEQAREELGKRMQRAKRVGEPLVEAYIMNMETGEIEQLYKNKDLLKDSKRTKDAPPPYYDPTDYPSIKSDYSIERIGREARHMDKDDPILMELDEVKAEIDELIAKGSEALIDAGWSKADARQAIANRYVALEKELRRNKLIDKARELHVKIRALEKAWDLRV